MRARALPGIFAGIAVVLCSLSAHAGQAPGVGLIRGRVETSDRPNAMPRPSLADVATGPAMVHEPGNRRASVVYLDPGPRGAFADLPAGRARLDQRHEQFVPHVLAITVGTIVDFPNNDLTFHNVFSLSPITHFDLGRYPVGQSKSWKFDRAGIIPVFCDIHSHMSAYILVFNHPFFALTDEDGKYTIPGIPPGTYSVAVWSEAGPADPQKVTIGDGSSLEVSFHVGRHR